MSFTAVARMNSLFWITSLAEHEQGVTRRILEDLKPLCKTRGTPFFVYEPQTADELLGALGDIADMAANRALPLVHFDLHGAATKGLFVSATGEFVSWEAVGDALRSINRNTGNNLCVVSCACASFDAVRVVDVHRTVPFFMYLAPEKDISAGTIEDNIVGFYRDMLDREDILAAYSRWFGSHLRVFHAEKMLAIVLAMYIDRAGIGKHKLRRREQLITTAIEGGVPASEVATLRKMAKELIEPDERLIDRFLPVFLAGKQPGFTVHDIVEMVHEGRRNGIPAGESQFD